ncbi:MAG TPA: hypothetical protein H9694_04610 [Firmicutes bacterium]|nr:hypothetical protein [Bacillota bacterium]
MKLKCKRRRIIPAGLLAALLALSVWLPALPAAADTSGGETEASASTAVPPETDAADKVYRIVEQDGQGAILSEPSEAAFWEYPLLPGGLEKAGRFRVVNETPRAVALTMTPALPYDDPAALTYFSQLRITLEQEDGSLLYEGPYTGLADQTPLLSVEELKPGEAREYLVTIRCPFSYTGDPSAESSPVSWEFRASARMVTDPIEDDSSQEGIAKLLIAAVAVLVVIGVILRIVKLVRGRRQASQK